MGIFRRDRKLTCFAFARWLHAINAQAVKATNLCELVPVFALNSELETCLFLAVYDEKRETGMELESEWNEELRWIFFQQGSR